MDMVIKIIKLILKTITDMAIKTMNKKMRRIMKISTKV
jgi:hypothetical protein